MIQLLKEQNPASLSPGIVGPGDDCAVIPLINLGVELAGGKERYLLLTTDLMVENRHFRLRYMTPYEIGWKLLAVNLSDIAAMGGTPIGAVITLQLRPDLEVNFITEMYRGVYELASLHEVQILGGDTCAGNELSLGVTVLGQSHCAPILRSGARKDDIVFLSGACGLAAMALNYLEQDKKYSGDPAFLERALKAFKSPAPKVELGKLLLDSGIVTSMIDVSDGILQDAMHIARSSNVTVEIEVEKLMAVSQGVEEKLALTGGEDYELLFCVRPDSIGYLNKILASMSGLRPFEVGRVLRETAGGEVMVKDKTGMTKGSADFLQGGKAGFSHF